MTGGHVYGYYSAVWNIRKRMEEAPVLTDPWPHMFITEVFTPDFYELYVSLISLMGLISQKNMVEYNTPTMNSIREWNNLLAIYFLC